MPLIHLPVQSGSNKILESMNRQHTIEEYLEIIEKLKKINSKIKFSSDFIIGYPGETQYDFDQTVELMKKVKFINAYSFIYSTRPGTPAFNLKEIDKNLAKERLSILQHISRKIKTEYRNTLISKTTPVLFENKTQEENKYFGRDEHFNSVIVECEDKPISKIKNVKITRVNQNTLFGDIYNKKIHKSFAA